ncbi:hypothetical protein VTJ04DRAFT_6968 [Mycothermus thermophilus]|uniref:uncharacterized protein n=1 Tax=Humicola insolens TaxID=85995 RepID=UPI0037427C50
MAPGTGAGIAAGGAVKPAPSRPPVIPALPLNFPQRPASKCVSVTTDQAPTSKSSNGTASSTTKPVAEFPNGASTTTKPVAEFTNGVSSTNSNKSADPINTCASSPSATSSTQAIANTPTSSSEGIAEDRDKETPTVVPTVLDRRPSATTMQSHRPPVQPNHNLGPMGAAPGPGPGPGPGPDAPLPAGHPALVHRPAYHQPHLSNGSMVFGAFHDSNASSPAPRSGSLFPPPGFLPYPPPAVDFFQGSQSSLQVEDHGFPAYHAVNGHGHPAGPVPPPPPMNGNVFRNPGLPPMYQDLHDQQDTIAFLRHGLMDKTFADCTLEVRFADINEFQDHPAYHPNLKSLRMPAHRFILSRSPVLADLMKAQNTVPGGVVFLDIKDEWMRSDTFWYSLRGLYGWSFHEGVLHTELPHRDARDDMKNALSYVATAHYLQLPWIFPVAIHQVTRLLHWNTIELAIKFVSKMAALSSHRDGAAVPELFDQVLGWLIQNFPVDFVLDVNVGDCGFSRLPTTLTAPKADKGAAIANGTSCGSHSRQPSKNQTQLPRHSRLSSNIRLSQIKFGDMSPTKDADAPRAPNSTDKILSRIVLNLPFELLKRVLEHPNLGKLTGEFDNDSRHAIFTAIIAEREARRLRALSEKGDAQLRILQERLEGASAPVAVAHMDDFWVNSMGFREEVFIGDQPYLVHTWSQGPPSSASA